MNKMLLSMLSILSVGQVAAAMSCPSWFRDRDKEIKSTEIELDRLESRFTEQYETIEERAARLKSSLAIVPEGSKLASDIEETLAKVQDIKVRMERQLDRSKEMRGLFDKERETARNFDEISRRERLQRKLWYEEIKQRERLQRELRNEEIKSIEIGLNRLESLLPTKYETEGHVASLESSLAIVPEGSELASDISRTLAQAQDNKVRRERQLDRSKEVRDRLNKQRESLARLSDSESEGDSENEEKAKRWSEKVHSRREGRWMEEVISRRREGEKDGSAPIGVQEKMAIDLALIKIKGLPHDLNNMNWGGMDASFIQKIIKRRDWLSTHHAESELLDMVPGRGSHEHSMADLLRRMGK